MTTFANAHKPRDRTKTGQPLSEAARGVRAVDERVVAALTTSLSCVAARVLHPQRDARLRPRESPLALSSAGRGGVALLGVHSFARCHHGGSRGATTT